MAKLPIVENISGSLKAQALSPEKSLSNILGQPEGIMQNLGAIAKISGDLSDKWQEAEDFSQTMDAKNKLINDTTLLMEEAEQYNDFKNPKDLKDAETKYLQRMSDTHKNIGSGFTNNLAAQKFEQVSSQALIKNNELIRQTFRAKTIDMGKGSLVTALATNEQAFLKTGNEAFKTSTIADIDSAVKAGYITVAHAAEMKANIKDNWDYNRAVAQVDANPEAPLNTKNLRPDQVAKLNEAKSAQIEKNIKVNEFNRLYNFSKAHGEMGMKVFNGEATLAEVNTFISTYGSELTEIDKQNFIKHAGYSVDNGQAGLQGESKPKLDPLQKQAVYSELLNMGNTLVSGGDVQKLLTRKNLFGVNDPNQDRSNILYTKGKGAEEQNKATKFMKEVNTYQSVLTNAFNLGAISKSELFELTDKYVSTTREYLKANLSILEEGQFGSGIGVLGYSELEKNEASLKNVTREEDRKIARIETSLMYDNYFNELTKYAKDNKLSSIYDIEKLSNEKQRAIYHQSAQRAIKNAKQYSSNPSYWFMNDYPVQAEAVQMSMPQEQAKKVLDNVGKKVYNDDNADVNHEINKELAKPQVQDSSSKKVNYDPIGVR